MSRNRAILLATASATLLAALPAAAQTSAAQSAAAAAPAAATATGQISGTVSDRNGNLVAGATVRIEGSNIVETTGPDGQFLIRSAPAGLARITVRYFGSDPVEQTVTVTANSVAEAKITVGASAADDDAGTITVIASRPIAESEAAALQLQRSSTALVNVLAADSIGRFPDQNLAAALGRLPGVGIQRDQGQDRFISLRGARNSWTTVSFDGINVVSPSGRTTRFDTIPSAIASKVIVRKAVTADLTGETVAGNVDVQTRSAFDYPGFKVAVDLGLGFSELGGGRQYNVNGHISDRFFNNTVGILLSASRFEVDMITDNFEPRWTRPNVDQLPGRDDRFWVNNFDNRYYRLTRSNQSFTGRLDWRPDNNNEIFLSSVWTQFRDQEQRQLYIFDFDDGAVSTNSTAPQLTARRTGFADIRTGNTPLQGTIFGVELEGQWGTSNSPQTIFTNTLGGNHVLGEWKVSWRGNFTRGDDEQFPRFGSNWRSPADRTRRPSVTYDFTDPLDPKLSLFQTLVDAEGNFSRGNRRDFISTDELDLVNISRLRRRDRTDAYTARLDIDRNINLFGNDTKLQFGMQYNDRDKTSNRTVRLVTPATLTAAGIALPKQADIIDRKPVVTGLPVNYTFTQLDQNTTEALLDSYLAAGAFTIDQAAADNNNYRVTEKVLAGYVMGTMFFENGNIVAGVRAERFENTGSALGRINNVLTPLNVSNSNTLFFPSLHVNYDATDEIKLRLSVNTGAARADYSLLRPNLNINDDLQIISGGNPLAEPEKAVGVDAYFEWYMANRGFFSVGVYYKKIRGVLFNSSEVFGTTELDEPGFARSTYEFNTTLNGGSGELKGIEIAYTQPFADLLDRIGAPDWAQGFGIQANLTINRSNAITPQGNKIQLPDTSRYLYNASVYYEQYGLSLRVSYQKRGEWLDSISTAAVGNRFWSSVGRLDLSARYAISPRMELFVDANNLTDTPGIRYDGAPERVYEFEQFGSRFMGGVRVNF
ncbi:TonB-dependent receptor [Sandarakinorhabdus sp.]|uniref:TonB-dependent receptor n=1 Tax=Sandarakinorhabdus sp. TaxID=1916663 RepID=UPI003F71CFEE